MKCRFRLWFGADIGRRQCVLSVQPFRWRLGFDQAGSMVEFYIGPLAFVVYGR